MAENQRYETLYEEMKSEKEKLMIQHQEEIAQLQTKFDRMLEEQSRRPALAQITANISSQSTHGDGNNSLKQSDLKKIQGEYEIKLLELESKTPLNL